MKNSRYVVMISIDGMGDTVFETGFLGWDSSMKRAMFLNSQEKCDYVSYYSDILD